MKTKLFYLLFALSPMLIAQNKVEYAPPSPVNFNPITIEATVCIPDEIRPELEQTIKKNKEMLLKRNPNLFNARGAHPLFSLPFRRKAGFDDYGYYSVFNQVDQYLAPNGQLLDYNCGERTYDWGTGNHGGTDYVVWPYPWKKMEDNVMEIIAAAPGVIVDKRDGNFDKNCDNDGNPLWNGIIVEHSDGSQAYY